VKKLVLAAVLLSSYGVAFVERHGLGTAAHHLDPLQPEAREVERAIANSRFADALRIATDLEKTYPQEPLVAYWLAAIYHGMDSPRDEAQAWERYMQSSSMPDEACPRIGQLYEDLGDRARALNEYERCAALDPRRPDRLVDLAEAAERFGDVARARNAFGRAAELDPTDVSVAEHLRRLSRKAPIGS